MLRNMIFQALFQLGLLLILLFAGAGLFGVHASDWCTEYTPYKNSQKWDLSTGKKSSTGTFGCADFKTYCNGEGDECIRKSFVVDATAGTSVVMNNLEDFTETCLECKIFDHVLVSIIFNAFIFCQVFNEYTARSLFDDLNPFAGVLENKVFIFVTIFSIGTQIFLIEIGGEFVKTTHLTPVQWLVTVALGAIGLPLGVLMRFFPVEEDPNSFFDNSKAALGYDAVVASEADEKSKV
jgi:magnesium-transporting ATPase (P-type)